MSEAEITRKSRRFYEQFQFPGSRPIDHDGLVFLRRFTRSIQQGMALIPGRMLRVLDAGCGTGNTSVSLARHFPRVAFFGIDQSRTSLAKAKALAARAGVKNARFRAGNLLQPLPWQNSFDLILCLGVLHHTADMKKTLTNLGRALGKGGELFLWIYGRHGRYRHSLNTRLLRLLLGKQCPPEVALDLAIQFALNADNGSPLRDLIGQTKTDEMQRKAFTDPVWIADQFLNPQEILIDMEGLLNLARSSGFELAQVLGMRGNVAQLVGSAPLRKRFEELSPRDQLIAQDLLLKPERYFVVLRKAADGAEG
jgi:SAM-dependent methyltransferase